MITIKQKDGTIIYREGDVVVDSSTGKLYVENGSIKVQVIDGDIETASNSFPNIQSMSNEDITIYNKTNLPIVTVNRTTNNINILTTSITSLILPVNIVTPVYTGLATIQFVPQS